MDDGNAPPPENDKVTLLEPLARYGNFVVADESADIRSVPFDVTVRANELMTVVFVLVPIVTAVVQSDVEMVSVDAVVKLLTMVNVG